MTVVSAIMWLTLGGFACGEDPVLRAAREEAEADRASAKKASTGGSPDSKVRSQRGHPMDGGTPGGSSTPQGEGAVTAEDPLPGVPEEPTPAPPGTPGGGAPPDQDNPVGKPGKPQPGVPDEPRPGNPEDPMPAGRKPPPTSGPTVTLSGRVVFEGFRGGMLRIDVFDGDHLKHGSDRPSVVAMVNLEKPGTFQVEVPESVKLVWISAFNDADRNERPGPLDPTGYFVGNPVQTTRGDQKNLTIELVQRAPPEDGGDDF